MSRLKELIDELCPDGVEFKRFDEACTLHARIGWQRLTRAEFQNSGNYLLITGTDFTKTHEINYSSCVYVSEERYAQDKHIQVQNGDILITKDGTLGKVAQVNGLKMPATLNGGVFVVRSKDGRLTNRFILHYLLSSYFQKAVDSQKTGSTISHLTQNLFSRLLIPVPPLEVQREIVRILDKFTELGALLETELVARKKQYKYYRSKLLTNSIQKIYPCDVIFKPLGEVVNFINGRAYKQTELLNEGKYKVLRVGNFYTNDNWYYSDLELEENKYCTNGDLLYTWAATIGPHIWRGEKAIYHYHIWKLEFDETLLNKAFLYHFLGNDVDDISNSLTNSTMPHVSMSNMQKRIIPLPPLPEQKRIAGILDRFDALCNDLSSGIPAEIAARKKQYEYYRDRLLTFREKRGE